MDGKVGRVLRWEKLLEIKANASTKIADYQAKSNGDWTIQFNQYACWDAPHEFYCHADGNTLAAAMDACESDYIARCSEFLPVAGPGQVVVDVILLQRVIEHLGSCYERKCDHLLALELAGDLSEAMAMGKTKGGAK